MRTLLVGAWAAAHTGNRIITPISEYKESNPLIPAITHCVQSGISRRIGWRPSGLGTATLIRAWLGNLIATLTILRRLRTVHSADGIVYKISLRANCICRDDPDSPVGNRVFVIRPKDGLPATLPGCPRFA